MPDECPECDGNETHLNCDGEGCQECDQTGTCQNCDGTGTIEQ